MTVTIDTEAIAESFNVQESAVDVVDDEVKIHFYDVNRVLEISIHSLPDNLVVDVSDLEKIKNIIGEHKVEGASHPPMHSLLVDINGKLNGSEITEIYSETNRMVSGVLNFEERNFTRVWFSDIETIK